MRPVDFQPAIVQAPSAERTQQQQQSQPQVSQQAFAGQMEKIAGERVHQVRETGPGHETRPSEDLGEEKREGRRRRGRKRPAASAGEKMAGEDNGGDIPPPAPGPHIDVRV